jgi:glycerate kinase
MKKIVIASDSFKGSLSAYEICNQIERGIRKVDQEVEIVKMPMADGGEGTVDAVLDVVKGRRIRVNVNDPFYRLITASYAILEDQTAVIEMAAASGLTLVEGRLDPMQATTYGTGQLIKDALNKGCRKFIIGIGGSATNDGGIGMAGALGARLLGSDDIAVPLNGKGLGDLCRIDLSRLDPRVKESHFTIACDVENPLYGENGAAYIYGPQKGADEVMVGKLDDNLRNYSNIIERDLGVDISNIPGAGAAGGLGGGLIAFMGAEMTSGIEIMMDMYQFDEKIEGADLIITGEGMIDSQSMNGKVVGGIAKKAKILDIPVIAMVGAIGKGVDPLFENGVTSIFSINTSAMDFSESKRITDENVRVTSEMLMRLIMSMK